MNAHLAKTRRDELWHLIAARYAPVFGPEVARGGGYLNPATRRFLRAYHQRLGGIPPEGRQSWPWTFLSEPETETAPEGDIQASDPPGST